MYPSHYYLSRLQLSVAVLLVLASELLEHGG